MLDPGRISKPQLFVVRKIIGDRNKLAKWQKMFVLTVTFTYFSFLPLSLVLLLLLFFTSATSACCGSLLSRVCCCVFDLSFFPPSPETFHLNILTLYTCHTLWYQSLSRHISLCWQACSVTQCWCLTCCLSGRLTLTEDQPARGAESGRAAQVEPDSEERRGQTTQHTGLIPAWEGCMLMFICINVSHIERTTEYC